MPAGMWDRTAAARLRYPPPSRRSRRTSRARRAARRRTSATGCVADSAKFRQPRRASRSAIRNAGVEPGIDHVEHEGGEAERHDDDKDDTLDDEMVVLADRLEKQGAHAGMAKDDVALTGP